MAKHKTLTKLPPTVTTRSQFSGNRDKYVDVNWGGATHSVKKNKTRMMAKYFGS